MADTVPLLPQMSAAADDREIVFNGTNDALSPSSLFGKDYRTTTGLVWGYIGGFFNDVDVPNGTVTATASNTNYVVAHRTTGAVSISTATTNWNNQTTYQRLWQLTAGVSTITAWLDKRQAVGITPGSGTPLTQEEVEDIVGALIDAGTGIVVNYDDAGAALSISAIKYFSFAVGDESTPLTAGTGKVSVRLPHAFVNLTEVRASLRTAQATDGGGGIFTVDINIAGVSILSTKLTVDNTEKTSLTAATPAVISDATHADDSEVIVDIDQLGDGTAIGLKISLIGT